MRRRTFLGRAALAGAALIGAACRRRPRPPNILVCISDDQSYPHAGAYGADFVSTPGFDRVAREGVLFRNAFVSAPSCAPSRGSLLAGQDFYRLREAAMNHTIWPAGLETYPEILAEAGYVLGYTGKGWGPGNWRVSGRSVSPVGPAFNEFTLEPPGAHLSNLDYARNFEAFLEQVPAGAPFCFWVGFSEPHRPFEPGIAARYGARLEEVRVPAFLPDTDIVRSDLADYAFEIAYYDAHLARILAALEGAEELERTLVVVTADNGMAFPRAKATLYEAGIHVPLAIRWGERVRPGRVVDDLVSLIDLAPTFLEAAGLPLPPAMTGRSLIPLLETGGSGRLDPSRDAIVVGLERHFPRLPPSRRRIPDACFANRRIPLHSQPHAREKSHGGSSGAVLASGRPHGRIWGHRRRAVEDPLVGEASRLPGSGTVSLFPASGRRAVLGYGRSGQPAESGGGSGLSGNQAVAGSAARPVSGEDPRSARHRQGRVFRRGVRALSFGGRIAPGPSHSVDSEQVEDSTDIGGANADRLAQMVWRRAFVESAKQSDLGDRIALGGLERPPVRSFPACDRVVLQQHRHREGRLAG